MQTCATNKHLSQSPKHFQFLYGTIYASNGTLSHTLRYCIIMLAAICGKRNVIVWRPSVRPSLSLCPFGLLTVTHQGAACDAASAHLGRHTCFHWRLIDNYQNVADNYKTEFVLGRSYQSPKSNSRIKLCIYSRPKCAKGL